MEGWESNVFGKRWKRVVVDGVDSQLQYLEACVVFEVDHKGGELFIL